MKILPVSVALVAFFISVNPLKAALGTLLANYNTGASDMVIDPVRPLLYATIPSTNSVEVIDTNTLAVIATIPIGYAPAGLAVTPDGSRLYVANSGSASAAIGVINLATLTPLPSLAAPLAPWSIQVGLNNRLYVTTVVQNSSGIMQIDGNTGAFQGYFSALSNYSKTNLQISPDQKTLYVADTGLSPASLAKFDVSTTTTTLIQATPFNSIGSNGEQLVISHNGQFISDVVGGGNTSYDIRMIPTNNLSGNLGSFSVGAYPNGIGFSPDDKIAYTNNTSTVIKAYSITTGLSTGQFNIAFSPSVGPLDMIVDPTGKHLFVSYLGQTGFDSPAFEVFDTGRSVPEPASGVLLLGGAGLLGFKRRR